MPKLAIYALPMDPMDPFAALKEARRSLLLGSLLILDRDGRKWCHARLAALSAWEDDARRQVGLGHVHLGDGSHGRHNSRRKVWRGGGCHRRSGLTWVPDGFSKGFLRWAGFDNFEEAHLEGRVGILALGAEYPSRKRITF